MNDHELLNNAITRSQEYLILNKDHTLSLGHRQEIWSLLGMDGLNSLGHRRRSTLAITTADYVFPIWESIWPNDDIFTVLVNTAKRVISGVLDDNIGQQIYENYFEELTDRFMDPIYQDFDHQRSLSAGYSALNSLRTVLQDEKFDPHNIDYNLLDDNKDFYDLDASHWASLAYAGAHWEKKSDPRKRLDFWRWWLNEAVPKAWETVQ